MAAQLTIRLTDDLSQALAVAAARMQRKKSEIIRLALHQFLDLESEDEAKSADSVHHLIGSLESGVPDLAENHRAYIEESLKHGG